MIRQFFSRLIAKKDVELLPKQLYKHNELADKPYRLITDVLCDETYEYVLFNDYGRIKSKKKIGNRQHLEENYHLKLKELSVDVSKIRRV